MEGKKDANHVFLEISTIYCPPKGEINTWNDGEYAGRKRNLNHGIELGLNSFAYSKKAFVSKKDANDVFFGNFDDLLSPKGESLMIGTTGKKHEYRVPYCAKVI